MAQAATVLFGDLAGGTVTGLYVVTFSFIYGALIFSGPLTSEHPLGFAIAVGATSVLLIVTALLSSLRFAVNSPDGTTVAMLALFAAGIAARAEGDDPLALVATVHVGLALAAVVIGAVLAGLGAARVGQAVRYVPYPVMAGFFAASGMFLIQGGLDVGVGAPVQMTDFVPLGDPTIRPLLAATVVTAGVIFTTRQFWRHPVALPALMLGCTLAYQAAFAALGISPPAAIAGHWIIAVPDRIPMFASPWTPQILARVDWRALLSGWSDILTAALVTALSTMLNTNALEAADGLDADINRDLRATGLAAVAAGAAGGILGTIGSGSSRLLQQCGGRTRFAGIVAGIVVAAVGLFAPRSMELLPTPVLGGMLISAGLASVRTWAAAPRRRLAASEWAMLLAIAAVTFWFGTLPGVVLGVLAACAAFAGRSAMLPVVTAEYRGDAGDSLVERSDEAREALRDASRRVLVLHLQGSLFFGTVSRLFAHVRRELDAAPEIGFLILDLGQVTELDSTATMTIERLRHLLADRHVRAMLATVPAGVARRVPAQLDLPHHATTAEALAWCEDELLTEAGADDAREPFRTRLLRDLGGGSAAQHMLDVMEPIELAPGEVLIRQGEHAHDLFFVESGRFAVEVTFPNGRVLRVRTIGPGTMIGEVGFYMGLPRTASVRADKSGARLLRLTRQSLEAIHAREPEAALRVHMMMAERLCHRIIDMNRLTAALARTGPVV